MNIEEDLKRRRAAAKQGQTSAAPASTGNVTKAGDVTDDLARRRAEAAAQGIQEDRREQLRRQREAGSGQKTQTVKPYQVPAAAAATLRTQDSLDNGMKFRTRSYVDRDSVVQGKAYEGAVAGLQKAAEQGDVNGYVQILNAAQKAYGNLQENAKAETRRREKEQKAEMEQLRKANPERYYSYTMTPEQVQGQIDTLTKKRDTIRGMTGMWSDGLGGTAEEKGRYAADRLNEIENELASWTRVKNYQTKDADRDNFQRTLEEYKGLEQKGQRPDLEAHAAAGKAKYEKTKNAISSTVGQLLVGGAAKEEYRKLEDSAGLSRALEDARNLENWPALEQIFYALWDTDPERARRFIASAKEATDNYYFQQIASDTGKDFPSRLEGLITGTATRMAGGVANLFDPYGERAQYLSKKGSAIIGGGAQGLQEKGLFNTGFLSGELGDTFPTIFGPGYVPTGPLKGKGLGDLYQLASSMLESGTMAAISGGVGGVAGSGAASLTSALGTIIMGSSAASSDYEECLKRGLTREQAMLHATSAGIMEAAFEYISLDKLVNQDVSRGFWKNFFLQAGIEASEEACTTIANRISDGITARLQHYDNQIEQRTKELIAMGLDPEEAKDQAEKEWLVDLFNDALGGAISGGLMTAGSGIAHINEYVEQNRIRNAERVGNRNEIGEEQSTFEVPGPEWDDGSRDAAGEDPSTGLEAGPPPLRAGEVQTGETEVEAARDGGPVPYGSQNENVETRAVYEQTRKQVAEQARGLDDTMLQTMAENVEQNLYETRDSAAPAELAVMEGQRDALREEIRFREAVNRNGERMEAAARAAEVPGVDWNDGSRDAAGENPSTGLEAGPPPLRAGEVQTGERIATASGLAMTRNENGGQIARTAGETGRQIAGTAGETGRQIAGTTEQGGLNYGTGTESAADGGQRNAGLGTRGQAGSLGESAGGQVTRSGGTSELRQLRDYVKALGAERASARDLGIRNGTKNASNVLIDVEALTGSMKDRLTALREKAGQDGVRLDFVVGQMETRHGGRTVKSSGVYQVDADGTPHVFIQADSMRHTAEQLYEHEMFHSIVARNKGMWGDIVRHLFETSSQEEIRAMVDAYASAYAGCYDNEADAVELYLEEILADVYAEMQRGGGQQSAARELAGETAQRFAGDIENARQNRAGIDRTNGPGTRLSFAGKNAETADLASLDEAKQLLEDGADSETVRQQTGWFRGMDGKWRFEIDDSGMEYRRQGDMQSMRDPEYREYLELWDKVVARLEGSEEDMARLRELDKRFSSVSQVAAYKLRNGTATLPDIIQHDALFQAYPMLQDVHVQFAYLKPGVNASYDKKNNTIQVSYTLQGKPEGTLLHEIQHVIQDVEEFAGGANLSQWSNQIKAEQEKEISEAEAEMHRLFNAMPEDVQERARQYNQAISDRNYELANQIEDELFSDGYGDMFSEYMDAATFLNLERRRQHETDITAESADLYSRTAGEVEARDTANRRELSAEQRKNARPDIDRKDVVFAKRGQESNEIKYPKYTERDLLKNSIQLQQMAVVKKLTGQEFPKGSGKFSNQILTYFDSIGNNVHSEQFGDVALVKSSVRSEIRHGMTAPKNIAFAAVPEVIQNGVVIFTEDKGKGVERILVAAPILIQNEKYYVGVMLQRDAQSQRLYTHDIIAEKETTLVLENHLNTTGPTEEKNSLFITDILRNAINVKGNSEESVDWIGNREAEQSFSAAEEKDVGGVDWLDGSELETTPRGEGSARWSDLRSRVSELSESQRRNLVAEAAELNNATWREEGLGIKPYSGDLADTEAVLRYVDDAVAAVKSEPGSAEYDPAFDIDALPGNVGSARWSDLRSRVSELSESQRKSLVAEAAELNNATWREEGLGIKPYSGDLADTEAVLRYVDDAVAAVKSEPGSSEYDPSFDLEALQRNEGSYRWSDLRSRVSELSENQRRSLVQEAADLNEATWREDGLGIKPYSGSLADAAAIVKYVDAAVDAVKSENGSFDYDPSFDLEALQRNEGSDLRFSAADEEDNGVDWLDGSELEDETPPHPSPAATPSPQGEGSGRETRRADVGIGPYEDEGRPVTAHTKTGDGGRSMSDTAEQSYAEQAREKKVEIARKASADGLKSRIQTAEERLKALKSAERMGLVTEESKRQELQRRIADTQETIDILKAELDRKKAARSAQKADKAARAEAKARRKAEKLEAQKAAELRENRPRQARKEFRQDALNLFSVPAAKRQTLGDLLNRFADKVIHQGSVTEQDRRELFSSLYEAGVETIQGDEYYKQIRDFARGGRIYVPQELRSEFGDDWDAFRKRAWGNGIYLTNDQNDRGADAWNVELAEMFPSSFDAQETDSRRILEGIVELAEEGKAEHVSIEEMMLRNQQETGVSVDEQMDELERKVDALIDTFAQKAELEVKLRKAGTMQLVKERQKNREIAARQVQRKKENDTRSQVMKQLQALNKMRKKSAPEIQRQIDEIIGNLDVMARSISPEGMENLQALARKYSEAAEDPNFLGNPNVEQRLARLEKVQLDSLEISDVIELGQTVAALVKSVTEDKRLLTDAREREISDAAEAANKEILSSEGSKGGKLREFLGNEHLSPTRMIQRLGGWVRGGVMEQLSRALEDGGTRRMEYQRQATRIFDKFLEDKANQKWLQKAQGKDAEWIKVTVPAGITGKDVLSGKDGPLVWQNMTFEITPMMRVGLLMHSKNKDNLRHIKTGGIVIPNKAEYIKGNLAEADARGTRVKLQPEVVRAIVKDCTAQERAFAALLEQYYDGFSKDRINEVSMQIDGFERAMTNNYYQIKVSRKFLAKQPEQIQKNYALDSIDSIVHERVHAGNPIILEDASAALTGHIDLISKYYGYTAAIRDFNAVMNYTFHEKATTEDGQEYTANAFAGSVKETLGEKWGSGAQKYLDNLLADLQQKSSINETAAQVMAKLRGNLAQASLMANPAVALSQLASIPGAAQVLGFDGVIAGLKPQKVNMSLVEKYSPLLWYRNQGNSTQELGDYIAAQGLAGKLPLLLNGIQKMDTMAIRRLWAGAEYRVSKDTDLSPGTQAEIDAGTDAYYQEVARVFQRAVYDTQPNYSEMQRPAILRSKSDLTKALTMYKTVPLQYYNMMYEAVGRLRADAARAKADPANKHHQAELSKSKSFAAKTFAGILGANVTYVVMKALVKGLLGGKKDKYLDEEGKLDAGKIFGNLGKDLIDTYAGSVIFGSDLLTGAEKLVDAITTGKYSRYGGTEISFLSAIEDVLGGVYDLATEIHKQDFRGGVGAIKDLAKQLAMVCGIPANNAETYLRGITKLISPEWADRYDNLFDEIERGDLKGQAGRDLRAAFRVLMDNRTDGLKDETVEELLRLWGNGQTVQVPSAVPASISIDGESHNLSADERSRFREIWGKTVSDSLEQLIESNGYEQADDIGKAKLIKKLYDYARQQAVEAAVGKEPDAWVLFGKACVAAGVGLEDYLAVAAVGKDKLKVMDGTELDAAIAGRMQFRIGELGADSLDELGRLFAAGASDVIPSDVPTSITVGGAEIKFSPEERVAWMQAWQKTAGESLEAVMGSKAYQAADDAGKEKLIAAVYDYARAAACSSVTDSYAPDKWITIGREAESRGIDADEYIIFRQQAKDLKSAEKLELLKKQSWAESQKEYIWMASMASEAQLTKYKPLKESGVKWAAALDLLGVGEVSSAGMTQEETARYQAAWDRISGPATKKLMANAAYRKADKATQSAYVDKLNAYTTQTAKAETVKGYTIEKWVELGQKLSKAGVALDEYIVYSASTSDAKSREKYAALNKTGWTESQKLEAMAYISESTHRVATVGMDYQVGLSYYLDALANADADQSGNINQEEAEDYIDRLSLGWEDKAYLWQMVCASSKWKNNPYSAGYGEEIWHDLHPEG